MGLSLPFPNGSWLDPWPPGLAGILILMGSYGLCVYPGVMVHPLSESRVFPNPFYGEQGRRKNPRAYLLLLTWQGS